MLRIALSIAVAAALAGCPSGGPDETGAESPRPSPGITLEGAQLTETRGGQKIWDLKAATVSYVTAPRVAELTDVTTRFYEKGQVVSTGTAPKATFHLGDRRLHLTGGIQVLAEAGEAGFSANDVRVAPEPGQLVAEGEVTFFRGANSVKAARLDADRSLRTVKLDGGVLGRFALTPDGTPVVPLPSSGI